MKKILLSLLLLIVVFPSANAQDVDSVTFFKVVNYLDCKLVRYSLEKGKEPEAFKKFNGKCDCDKEPSFTSIQSSIGGEIKKTQALAREIYSAKKAFKPNWKVDDAINYLRDTLFQKNAVLAGFEKKYQDDISYVNIKNSIADQIRSQIKPVKPTEGKAALPPSSDSPASDNSSVKEPPPVFTLPVIIICIVVGILIILVITIFGKLASREIPRKIVDFVDSRISKAIQSQNNNQRPKNAPTSNEYSTSTLYGKDFEHQLKALDDKLKQLQNEVSSLKEKQVEKPIVPLVSNNKSSEDIFFLSSPNTDGSFDNNDISPIYKDSASIYRLIKTSNNRGTFQIEDKEDSIRRALQYPDKRIDPVCEALNAFNPNAKSIKTINPGEVELVGDKWVISYNRKAKIRYE